MIEAHLHLSLYIFVTFDLFGPHENIKSLIKVMTIHSFIVNSIVHYIMLDVISYYRK
jgi:L-asparagine transporter-like permease